MKGDKNAVIQVDVSNGWYRIGNRLNRVEGKIPDGHECRIEGFRVVNGKITRKGKISFRETGRKPYCAVLVGNSVST